MFVPLSKHAHDLTGRRFGRLVAVGPVGIRRYRAGASFVLWRCRCACGNLTEVQSSHLTTGNTRSCGCLRREAGHLHGKARLLTMSAERRREIAVIGANARWHPNG